MPPSGLRTRGSLIVLPGLKVLLEGQTSPRVYTHSGARFGGGSGPPGSSRERC